LLATWFNGSPRNVGIACKPSGLVVIDQDSPETLEDFAASLGESVPPTYRVRTRRGWHPYFAADPARPLGNSAGALAGHGMDVRGGGKAYGGYVVGAGSVHESGHVYTAEDDDAEVAPLPDWLRAQITRAEVATGEVGLQPAVGPWGPGWDDLPRHGRAEDFIAQYRRHLAGVVSPTGEFRHQLFLAALDGWRCVRIGLLDEDAMLKELADTLPRVWSNPPGDDDWDKFQVIVHGEAAAKAAESPWVVAESGAADDSYSLALAAEVRRERLRREARAVLAAEDAMPPVTLSGAAFLTAPQPRALIGGLLYADSLAHIYGPDGSGKSLFVLDVALSLASGRKWKAAHDAVDTGRNEPAAVHYVMAEGQAVNVSRAKAWLAHHDMADTAIDTFTAIPTPIALTAAGVSKYLEIVERDKPVLVILDTKNAMIAGNESDPTDVAELVRAMHSIRGVCGACVWLVDHTGVADKTRARGSGALKAAVDTQHSVTRDETTGVVEVRRHARKNDEAGLVGTFRLRAVGDAAVCIPADGSVVSPLQAGQGWWIHDPQLVPDVVAELTGKGRSAARDVYRILRFVDDPDGLTTAEIRAVLNEGPRVHARSAYFAGLAGLKEAGVLVGGSTPARWCLAAGFAGPE
jgi:hypothetical protein